MQTDKLLKTKEAAAFLNLPTGSGHHVRIMKLYSVDKGYAFRLPYYELSSGRGYKIEDLVKFRELSQRKEPK